MRTTILIRRHERRQKVEDAKQAAIFGVKQAGQKGAEAGAASLEAAGRASKAAASAVGRGGAAAGSAVARGGAAAGSAVARGGASMAAAMGRGAVAGARASGAGIMAGGAAAGRMAAAGYGRLQSAAAPHAAKLWDATLPRLEPAVQTLLRPSIALPLTIVAVVVGLGAAYRWFTLGFDADVLFAGSIAAIAGLLALLPRLAVGETPRPLAAAGRFIGAGAGAVASNLPSGRLGYGLTAALALLVTGGVAWWLWQPGLPGSSATLAETSRRAEPDVPTVQVTRLPDLKGRGSAVGGDLIKVAGSVVKLSGVEAPERDQSCPGASGERSWNCGRAAQDALARLVRSQPLVCQLGSTDESGNRLATCTAGSKDVADELVRGGHVFASSGFFARYGAAESDARARRVGVWRSDAPERPSDYRSKRWAEAKQNAPQGCPIKGSVARGARTYVLPWSPSYERVRVRESRGERWFCSEQEARAAGWRPTAL